MTPPGSNVFHPERDISRQELSRKYCNNFSCETRQIRPFLDLSCNTYFWTMPSALHPERMSAISPGCEATRGSLWSFTPRPRKGTQPVSIEIFEIIFYSGLIEGLKASGYFCCFLITKFRQSDAFRDRRRFVDRLYPRPQAAAIAWPVHPLSFFYNRGLGGRREGCFLKRRFRYGLAKHTGRACSSRRQRESMQWLGYAFVLSVR
jgi:hypothetical protein